MLAMKSKWIPIFLVTAFIAIISLPMLCINKVAERPLNLENRVAASFPKFFDPQTGSFRKQSYSEFESWLNDNIGFRESSMAFKANIDYGFFRASPSEKVMIGEDGYLFYTQENNLEIAIGKYPLNEEMLQAITQQQIKIQHNLEKMGIQYILIFTPSKASIYPEKLPGGKLSIRETPMDTLTAYLREHTTIPVINTKDAVLQAKVRGDQVFYKQDTHWTAYGTYAAYQSIINELSAMGLVDGPPQYAQPIYTEKPNSGDLANMTGVQRYFESEVYPTITGIKDSKTRPIDNEQLLLAQQESFPESRSFVNVLAQGKRALVYGDSFFYGSQMPELLSQHFAQLDFLRGTNISHAAVQSVKPDALIFEMTERSISALKFQTMIGSVVVDNFADEELLDTHLVKYALEPPRKETDGLDILGWAFAENLSADGQVTYVEATDVDGKKVTVKAEMFYRQDVCNYFKDERYGNSGFSASVPGEWIQPTIRIIIENAEEKYASKSFELQ